MQDEELTTAWSMIETGVKIAIPRGYAGVIKPRSGLAFRSGVQLSAGLIDPDYRGTIKVVARTTTNKVFVPYGKPIAQLILSHVALPNIKIVQKFSEEHKYDSEDRKGYKMVRLGGFGSSDVATGIDNMGMIAETETDPALHVAAKSNTGPALCRVKRKELYKARRRHLTVRKDTHGPGLSGAHPTSTDQRPGDEQVISKPLSERRQRGRADVLAEEIIATAFMEGRCIYDEEITEAISAWKFRKTLTASTSPEANSTCYRTISDTIGH